MLVGWVKEGLLDKILSLMGKTEARSKTATQGARAMPESATEAEAVGRGPKPRQFGTTA